MTPTPGAATVLDLTFMLRHPNGATEKRRIQCADNRLALRAHYLAFSRGGTTVLYTYNHAPVVPLVRFGA